MPITDEERRLAEGAARVIARVEAMGLPDAPHESVPPRAIRVLARAHVELLDGLRALADGGVKVEAAEAAGPYPRLVPAETSPETMAEAEDLAAIYRRVMHRSYLDFGAEGAKFIVRAWDGMDGCWTDVTGDVDANEALRAWTEKTGGGKHHISYDEIDYYAIFPGGTRMYWDGSEGKEAFR